jgi:DNA-binding HxlR family transcriptional regulator
MYRGTFNADICVMTKVVDLLNGRWKPIILYLIQHDINRFGAMKKRMPTISKKVLSHQLREMEKDGLISRNVMVARAPQIVVYGLTEKGFSVRQLIDHMIQWGLVYFRDEYGAAGSEVVVSKK